MEKTVPTARAIWLQGPYRPFFAWYHCPDDQQARAGAVVCPPLGLDYSLSHYTMRKLAEHLADVGFCVVRLDYDGTGDSLGGNEDPDRVSAWLGSVASARACLRRAGLEEISVVGMRLGATLAAVDAAEDGRIDQLVLWDPTGSGRSFLAQQHALSVKLGVPDTCEDGSVEIPGAVFDATAVRNLRDVAIRDAARPLARRVLVLTRSDRPVDSDMVRPTMGLEAVVHEEAIGQAALLGRVSPYQELPLTAVRRIVDWLSNGAPTQPRRVRVPTESSQVVVGHGIDRRRIIETAVRVPPVGLFGILTEQEQLGQLEEGTGRYPAVIFLSVATESHIGPARLWVELARRWASAGFRVLRLDLSGLGDSPHRIGDDGPWACFKPEAFDDVVDAARWISPEDPSNVVLVGLCASGYQALESALALGARGAVAVNPRLAFVPPEHREGRPVDERRRIALPKDAVPPSLRKGGRLEILHERFPDLTWRVRILSSPQHRSAKWLTALVRQGTDTLIVASDVDIRETRQGITAFQLRRLERTGLLRLEHIRGLQHGLLIASQRDMIAELVSEHVLSRFSRASGPSVNQALAVASR